MTRFVPEHRPRRTLKTPLDNPTAVNDIDLQIGDVVMGAKLIADKEKKGKTFTWRFFAMVTKTFEHQRFVEALVLDGKEREPMMLSFYREDTSLLFIPADDWPDGVHALRTRAILDGRVQVGLF